MKSVYLSDQAGMPLIEYLKSHGFAPQLLNGNGIPVYKKVRKHADIQFCRMGIWENIRLFAGNPQKLQESYPGNIRYNAICTGKYFIHNLKYTDPNLLQTARTWHQEQYQQCGSSAKLQMVDVPQGYSRCCCMPVDDTSFITSDQGIAKALSAHDADVLLIEKGHILLPGFDYGFIGGCGGNLLIPQSIDENKAPSGESEPALAKNFAQPDRQYADAMQPPQAPHFKAAQTQTARTIVFNGNLEAHPDYEKIAAFLSDRDIALVSFKDFPLMDIGSILTE